MEVLPSLGLILGLGVVAQLLAKVARVPALLVLLAAGILVGPVLGWLDPRETFGDEIVFPLVGLGVGLLLFEGGLALRFRDLGPAIRRPVGLLVTTGVAVTFVVATLAAYALLEVDGAEALLLGAIVTVSGPTVVGPLLAAARPRPPTSTVLGWEGILIDPVGATLAVTVLNAYFASEAGQNLSAGVLLTGLLGLSLGLLGAVVVVVLVRGGVPEDLQVAVMLTAAVGVYVVAEGLRQEAGLFATVVLGVALANQRFFDLRAIAGFTENVAVLVIGVLFVTLAADLDLSAMFALWPAIVVLCLVLALTRHLVVYLCTSGVRGIGVRERLFMGLLAPRGVVAAATASSFALVLEGRGTPFEELAPMAYGVIIGMALLASLSIPGARLLGVRRPDRRGLLLVGSEPWIVRLAEAAAATGTPVWLVTPGRADLAPAAESGVRVGDPALVALGSSPALEDAEYCVTATGAVESDSYVWSVVREELGQARVLAVPSAGQDSLPGVRRAFPRLTPDELREADFHAHRDPVAEREAGSREVDVLGVEPDGQILLRPAADPEAGRWVVTAVIRPVGGRTDAEVGEWA